MLRKDRKYNLWFWRHEKNVWNLGEHFAPELMKFWGFDFDVGIGDHTVLVIGSELHKHKIDDLISKGAKHIYVIGQGKGHGKWFDIGKYPVHFHLVRGNNTCAELGIENVPTGDPGFLMPKI